MGTLKRLWFWFKYWNLRRKGKTRVFLSYTRFVEDVAIQMVSEKQPQLTLTPVGRYDKALFYFWASMDGVLAEDPKVFAGFFRTWKISDTSRNKLIAAGLEKKTYDVVRNILEKATNEQRTIWRETSEGTRSLRRLNAMLKMHGCPTLDMPGDDVENIRIAEFVRGHHLPLSIYI